MRPKPTPVSLRAARRAASRASLVRGTWADAWEVVAMATSTHLGDWCVRELARTIAARNAYREHERTPPAPQVCQGIRSRMRAGEPLHGELVAFRENPPSCECTLFERLAGFRCYQCKEAAK